MSATSACVARLARRWCNAVRQPARRASAVAAAGMALAGSPGRLIEGSRGTASLDAPRLKQQDAGIRFNCGSDRSALSAVQARMRDYLEQSGIPQAWVLARIHGGGAVFTLNTPPDDTATLDFVRRRGMDLEDAVIHLPAEAAGKPRAVHTVSRKEIVLALLQHGRMTELPCRFDALEEQVGVRQNIVAWAETLDWQWPNGGPARWNRKYWRYGTPSPRHPLHEAVNDAFLHPRRYGIGCYTATKLVVLQGVLDYYARVSPDPEKLQRIEARMAADGEPLVGLEPGAMWYFEDDYSAADARPGKLVRLQQKVAADNFVPGDWVYLRNTDAKSHAKTGYEGSNAIYLGRGRFDDYYGEHGHSFSFREKLDEVYQWRHGVFSRSRDAANIHPLDDRRFLELTETPDAGGLLEGYRGVVATLDTAADAVEISSQAR
jgi:hypothetical protein